MGDYLNRRAEIVATPFTGDDRLINAASGDIVGLARGNTSEAFIMTKIKVGFRPVVSHIDFTMLIGRHRARIDEIGRAHVCTPVTNATLVCRLLLAKKKK